MVQGLLFEGSMLADDPTTNRAKWILVWGYASDLSPVEEAFAWESSNIVLHDPTEVMKRMDHFGEQRGEGSVEEAAAEMLLQEELAEEAMDRGYQPDSDGGEDSDSMYGPHSPRHAAHCSPLRCCHRSSISWADQCPSEGKDQHEPEDVVDASCDATEESEGEEQSIPLASPQDEHEPAEGSAVSGQESLDVTSTRGDLPGDK